MNKSLVLVGMNVRPLAQSAVAAGFDVVALDAFLEVKPSYSASMELAEEALAVPLFLWHTAGCRRQSLPVFPKRHDRKVFGKAIVYAQRDGRLPDTTRWLAKGRRDVPHAGGPIHAGFPICTVTASGRDQQQCYARLLAEADELLNGS